MFDSGRKWVPYHEREEWKDVKPVPQDELDSRSVVRIAYSDKFSEVHDYIRAVMIAQEYSHRALDLTAEALILNPANYTVWHYRREILDNLHKQIESNESHLNDVEVKPVDWEQEFDFIGEMVSEHPKNYQVWYHQRWLAERFANEKNGQDELDLTSEVLENDDSKNYHAWEHRQWTLKRFQIWDDELDFTEKLIKQDFRNNSAWNQRYFVIQNTTGFTPEVVEAEREFCTHYICMAPCNESSWNYLRGIYSTAVDDAGKARPLCDFDLLRELAETIIANENGASSTHSHSFLLDWHVSFLEKYGLENDKEKIEACQSSMKKCITCADHLRLHIDRIRIKYWTFVRASLLDQYPHCYVPGKEEEEDDSEEEVEG